MSYCLNKNTKEYKTLSKRFGDLLAEHIIRKYNTFNHKSPAVIEYPSIKEAETILKRSRLYSKEGLIASLNFDPNLDSNTIIRNLKGIIHSFKGNYYITRGRDNELLNENSRIMLSLQEMFPDRFIINGTKVIITQTGPNDLFNTPSEVENAYNRPLTDLIDHLTQINVNNRTIQGGLIVMLDKLRDKFGVTYVLDYNSPYKGRIKDGVVIINPNLATLDTPIHEYLHPFIEMLSNSDKQKDLYRALSAQAKRVVDINGKSVYEDVKRKYPELIKEEDLIKETIVQAAGLAAIGNLQEGPVTETFIQRLANAFKKILNFFGIKTDIDLYMPIHSLVNVFLDDRFVYDLRLYTEDAFQKSPQELFAQLNEEIVIKENTDNKEFVIAGEKKIPSDFYIRRNNPVNPLFRVHDAIIEPFTEAVLGKKLKNIEPTEASLFSRELGTDIHNLFDKMLNLFIDPDTKRYIGRVPDLSNVEILIEDLESAKYLKTNDAKYELASRLFSYLTPIGQYVYDMMEHYKEENPQYFIEQRVISEKSNVAGTIDLLILGDTWYDIYDWKTINPYTRRGGQLQKIEQTNLLKENQYKLQINTYAEMLSDLLPNHKLRDGWVIPIGTKLSAYGDDFMSPKELEMSTFKKTTPSEDRLLYPVKTNINNLDKQLQEFLSKLDTLIQEKSKEAFADKDDEKHQYVSFLRKVYQDILVKKDSDFLIRRIDNVLFETEKLLANSNTVNEELLPHLEELLNEIKLLENPHIPFKGYLKITDQLLIAESKLASAADNIRIIYERYAVTLGQKEGVSNILAPERLYTGLKRNLREISAISDVKTVKVLSKIYSKVKHELAIKTNRFFQELRSLHSSLKKGGIDNHYDYFFQKDKKGKKINKLIIKVDFQKIINEFSEYGKLENAIRKGAKDPLIAEMYEKAQKKLSDFRRENLIFDQEKHDKAYDKYKRRLESLYANVALTNTELENLKTPEEVREATDRKIDSIIESKLEDWTENNKFIRLVPKEGNYELKVNLNFYKFKEGKDIPYYSDEYIKLAENKDRVVLYNMIMDINNKAYELGAIRNPRTFFPSVLATNLEKIKSKNFKTGNFLDEIIRTLDPSVRDNYSPLVTKTNPITGKTEYKIKTMFDNDFSVENEDGTKDYSAHSFNIMSVYIQYKDWLDRYETQNKLENTAKLLISIERNKKNVAVDDLGRTKYRLNALGERVIEYQAKEQNKNVELLQDLSDMIIYGSNGLAKSNINVKILGKTYSSSKALRLAMNWRSKTSLGFSLTAGVSAMFGAQTNSFFVGSSKMYFDPKDIAKMYPLISGKLFNTKSSKKAWELIDDIQPLLDGLTSLRKHQLSSIKGSVIVSDDALFSTLSEPDKVIQRVNALSVLNNMIIDKEGKPMFLEQYVRKELDYANKITQNSTIEEINEMDKRIKERVKELKEKESIFAKHMAGNKNTLTVEQMAEIRAIIQKVNKKIIGNLDPTDVMAAKNTLLGVLMLQFKNWMPRLVTERWGSAEMDNDLNTLNWGKYKVLSTLFSKPEDRVKYSWKNYRKYISPFVRLIRMLQADAWKNMYHAFGANNEGLYKKMWEEYNLMLEKNRDNGFTDAEFVSFGDFRKMYIGSIRSSIIEIATAISFTIMLTLLTFMWDDDDGMENTDKSVLRMLSKLQDEITFYGTPNTFIDLIKNPLPVMSLVGDIERFLSHFVKEIWNQGQQLFTGDEQEDLDKAQPTKYFAKLFPISKEVIYWMAVFDEEFAKEYDIRINYKYNRR